MFDILESIHSFLEKRPSLTLVIFLIACIGTCLVPLIGIPFSAQIDGEREQGAVIVLISLGTLVCLGTLAVMVSRSPLRPGSSPHDALIACGFTQKAKSEQLPTYLNIVAGRQVTVNYPANNTTLALTIECPSDSDVILWAGKTQAIVMPLNRLFGRRRLTSDMFPDDIVCMARDIKKGKVLLENPQVRGIIIKLLTYREIASAQSIAISRKTISFTMSDFQTGVIITPDILQQWIGVLSELAEITEKQIGSSGN